MLANLSEQELLDEILVAPREAFVPLEDTQIIKRPGFMQIVTPSFRQGGFNEVCQSELADEEADALIDEAIDRYRTLGLKFRWSVAPGSRPADLGERLARRGLRPSETCGMARETAGTWDDEEGVTVHEVDEATVDDFTATMARGWEMDPAPLDAYHRLILAHPERGVRLFVARYRGEPAGAAGLCTFARSVYLLGAVVIPEFRGRGLYRALVAARLRAAVARGIPLATSQARATTSAPILERLGFETVCRYPTYSSD